MLTGILANKESDQNAQKEKSVILPKSGVLEQYNKYLSTCKNEFDSAYNVQHEYSVSQTDFELFNTLGSGSFGYVVLCKEKKSDKYFAMKIIDKGKIMKGKQIEHALNEKLILQSIKFPFIINLVYFIKGNSNLYYILPFLAGGDLFTLLRRNYSFKEREAKFYAAQICLALEYLHFIGVVYRDLKPENIIIDTVGYLKLADLGFCKLIKYRTWTLCGTPEYIAPEIILSKGYGKAVDWWSFGIFIYELLAGYTPFYANDPMKIYEKCTSAKYKFTSEFSSESKDLIRNLLQIDLSKRYGNLKDGVIDIKQHRWFKSIDWSAIYNRKVLAPHIPKIKSPADTSNFGKCPKFQLESSEHEKYAKEFKKF